MFWKKALGNVYAAFELEPDAKFEAVELQITEYNNMHIPKGIASHVQLHSIHRNQESSDLSEQQSNATDRQRG